MQVQYADKQHIKHYQPPNVKLMLPKCIFKVNNSLDLITLN